MILRRVFIAIGCVLLSPLSQANSSLGEVNIELRGNVVDFTCAVVAGDSNKSVNLGTADKTASRRRGRYATGSL